MNNPEDVPINAQEEIDWLIDYRATKRLSWASLAAVTGIAEGTLNPLLLGKYKGNIDNQARRIFQFRQKVASQTIRSRSALAIPPFIDTPASRDIMLRLEIAQMGRITVVATGPGTGKTMTAQHYKASIGDTVWYAAMLKSSGSIAGMIDKVMRAMKIQHKSGWTRQRSDQVMDFVGDREGLLIIDEANHLDLEAIEELRGWHDATGVGIALLGNEELWVRIKGGADAHAYARLNSRIASSYLQDAPSEDDVRTYLAAIDIDDPDTLKLMVKVALSPRSGGLREVRQILEIANMLAIGREEVVEHCHVVEAERTRSKQQLRRAA